MSLSITVPDHTAEALRALAQRRSKPVEQVVAELVEQAAAATDTLASWRWVAPDGRPWSELSAEERAAHYKRGYAEFPVGPDEFAVADEDLKGPAFRYLAP